MFADNIALYHVIRTRADYIHLQDNVISVSTCIGNFFTSTLTSANWCSSQGRGLTPYIHIPWPWMGQAWAEFPVIKYLGVTVSSDLSWSPHTTNCCNKTRRLTRLLYRRFYQHTKQFQFTEAIQKLHLYLEFSSQGWNWISWKCTIVCPSSLFEILGFWIQWTAQSCQSSTPAQEMSSIKVLFSTRIFYQGDQDAW